MKTSLEPIWAASPMTTEYERFQTGMESAVQALQAMQKLMHEDWRQAAPDTKPGKLVHALNSVGLSIKLGSLTVMVFQRHWQEHARKFN